MATGYTSGVVFGEVTSFADFAKTCARAFGALVGFRDDPVSPDIPTEVKPDTSYYEERLSDLCEEFEKISAMDELSYSAFADEEESERRQATEKYISSCASEDARIAAMQSMVNAWTPPTDDHCGLKDFMIQQLSISKHGDVRHWHSKVEPRKSREDRIAAIESEIAGFETKIAKEKISADLKTEWIQQLLSSLETLP
jgi:hypothetical protein